MVQHKIWAARHKRHWQSVNLRSRSNKGGRDDSDDEEGSSQPKKQRKPKERRKLAKVLPGFFSPLSLPWKIFLLGFMPMRFCCRCPAPARATATFSQREDQVQGHHLVLWILVRWGWTENSRRQVKELSYFEYNSTIIYGQKMHHKEEKKCKSDTGLDKTITFFFKQNSRL